MQTHSDVPCTVCGCVCDDLTLTFDGSRLVSADRACKLARPWFDGLNQPLPPVARVAGREVSLDDAIAAAAEILDRSQAPLIYGLSRSSTPGQRAAVRLGETIGAIVDTTASVCHGPSIMAIQEVGESTCSLGEVKERSDLVIFWGADPAESHPRHFERYSADPVSDRLPNGRSDRTLVVIDSARTASSDAADLFLQIAPGRDFELIWTLRDMIRNESAEPAANCGLPAEAVRDLARRLRTCRYGVVFFGLGLAQSHLGHVNVEALLRLVADLNGVTRFVARRLRIPGDVSGADSVLCWQTGFPFGVDLARGVPRYNPGEFTGDDLLRRGDVDACLIIGSESVAGFSEPARAALAELPTIVLDYPQAQAPFAPGVQFTTAVYGIHAAGTVYRMDEIPLPLRRLCDSPLPTDESILTAIQQRVTARF